MGVAQWVEASAVVLAGAGRLRLGHASSGIWGRGRLGVRETRVKLGCRPWWLVKRA